MKKSSYVSCARNSVMIATLLGAAACAPKHHAKVRFDLASLQAAGRTASANSEKIALAGEQLLTAGNFMYADEIFNVALKTDSKNQRALLYKKLVAPFMQLRGMATRIRPILTEKAKAELDASVAQAPNTAIKTFVTEGGEEIKSEKDVQKAIDEIISALNSAREHLKATKSQEITLNVPEFFQAGRLADFARDCESSKPATGVYEVQNCDLSKAFEFKMNRADKEVLQQQLAGMQIYLSILNAYSAEGIVELSKVDQQTRSQKDYVQDFLRSHPRWGVLRNPRLMQSILAMGNDAVKGVRWMQANQSTLCPNPSKPNQRKGHVFEDGFCIENTSRSEQVLTLLERALSGQVVAFDAKDGSKIEARPAAILINPIADLKSQLPIVTDECGNLKDAPDQTLGGLFPNGDLGKVMSRDCAQPAGIQ